MMFLLCPCLIIWWGHFTFNSLICRWMNGISMTDLFLNAVEHIGHFKFLLLCDWINWPKQSAQNTCFPLQPIWKHYTNQDVIYDYIRKIRWKINLDRFGHHILAYRTHKCLRCSRIDKSNILHTCFGHFLGENSLKVSNGVCTHIILKAASNDICIARRTWCLFCVCVLRVGDGQRSSHIDVVMNFRYHQSCRNHSRCSCIYLWGF